MLLLRLSHLLLLLVCLCLSTSSPLISRPEKGRVESLTGNRANNDSGYPALAVRESNTPKSRLTINGYHLTMLGYTTVLPFGIAAEFMQELCADVVREANVKMQQGSRDDLFQVSLGLVVASFQSLDGLLDWRTVIAFAAKATNEAIYSQTGLWRAALQKCRH